MHAPAACRAMRSTRRTSPPRSAGTSRSSRRSASSRRHHRDTGGSEAAMKATRPPDARRARHEASGEWPQPSLAALLDERVRRTPDRLFVIEGKREGARSYTFRDVHTRALRMAAGLRRLGVEPGDVVAWQLPNWVEGAALAVAIDRIGA